MVQKFFFTLFFFMPATPSPMGWLFMFFLCILLASVVALRWFARLSPARRRDVVRLVKALRRR